MCHVSELAHGFVKNVTDVVKIGDVVKVKVINVDDSGRVKLSRKALMEMPAGGEGGDRGDRGDRGPRGDRGGDRGHRGDRRDGGRREREGSPSGSDRA
jgi:polyribonucleotide nucleotidyltransferase